MSWGVQRKEEAGRGEPSGTGAQLHGSPRLGGWGDSSRGQEQAARRREAA